MRSDVTTQMRLNDKMSPLTVHDRLLIKALWIKKAGRSADRMMGFQQGHEVETWNDGDSTLGRQAFSVARHGMECVAWRRPRSRAMEFNTFQRVLKTFLFLKY